MKLGALFIVSGYLSALDPGCGAGVGANTANGASGDAGPSAGTELAPAQMSCGALGAHFFCDDFSRTTLPSAFDKQVSSAGTLAIESDESVSAPNALLASTLHITTGMRTFARLEKSFARMSTRFMLSYAQWVDPACLGPLDGVETGVVSLKGNTYWVAIRLGRTDAILESTLEGGVYAQAHELRTQMKRGQWVHVALTVDISRNTMGLAVDGSTVVQDEPLRYPPGGPRAPYIAVGTLTDNGAWTPSACKVRIDDVTLDLAP